MWITSKLTIPAPLHNSIRRTGILEELKSAHQYKLVLFQSPAGYGKTTAAAQWMSEKQYVGWCSLDSLDNSPAAFAHYFIAALNQATQGSCSKTLAMVQKKQFTNLKSLFTQVLNEISDITQLTYLVLDDYHLIKEQEIHAVLRYFIKNMPPNLTLVITSRTTPNIGIANLRVHYQLLEVDNQLLAFNDEETHRFLSKCNENLTDKNLNHQIRSQVEGWASALQLVAMSSKKTNALPKISSTHLPHLWDYLAEEVFEELNEEDRQFLMQCSVLTHFNHELVSFITKTENLFERLSEFNKQGLLLRLSDAKDDWYRFHNLFAQFLSYQRQRLMPEQEDILRTRAIDAWLSVSKLELALACAMEAKTNKFRIKILLEHGWKLFNLGDFPSLNKALQGLSSDELFSHPPLVLLKAWLAQAQHRYLEAGEQLELGIKELARRNISLTSHEQGEYYALMAQVAINHNQAEQALALSEKAFEHLSSNSSHARVVATSVVAEVHYCFGQLNRAFPLMQQAEKLARQYDLYQPALWALLQQSEIDIARGATNSGLERLNKAQELIKRHHLEQLPLYEFMLRIRSLLMWNLNRIDEAEETANLSLSAMSHYDKSKSLPAYTQLAKNALVKGEISKAQQYIHQCEKLLEYNEYHLDWRANVSMAQLTLWQLKESKERAAAWLETAEIPTSATNHFLQQQHRNLARAHYILGQYNQAISILENIYDVSENLNLVTESQFNLAALAVALDKTEQKEKSENRLIEAIQLSTQTGMMACFYLEPVTMLPILHRLVKYKDIDKLVAHQIKMLIDSMNEHNTTRALHFDESIVKKILQSDRLPDAIRASPLTHREWQVMGLIYSGFSNEQISTELEVAPTTTKTHIRNLYQKLQVGNREQAINLAERLIKTINY